MTKLDYFLMFLLVVYTLFSGTLMALAQNHPLPLPCDVKSSKSTMVYPAHLEGQECSHVTLGPPEVENAVATVTFRNTPVHSHSDNGNYDLTWNDIRVTIYYSWTSGNDSVTVIPHGGLTSDPTEASVPEDTVQKYHLYKYTGM